MRVKHITQVIGFLNARAEYALLRNYEALPEANDARDIDIIIERKSYKKLRSELLEMVFQSGWRLFTLLKSDRLETLLFATIDPSGQPHLVQWDFFFDTSCWGLQLMSAREFLRNRQFNGKLYHVSLSAQFLDKFLYNTFVGRKYPAKYQHIREQTEYEAEVEEKLIEAFGCATVAEAEATKPSQLRRRLVLRRLLRHPLSTLVQVGDFLTTFTANYINSRTGFSLAFTGPDGVGKTTVISQVNDLLGPAFSSAALYLHFRPTLLPNLGDVGEKTGIKKDVDRNFDDPHRGKPTSALSSLLRLAYYTLDYVAGHFLVVKPQTRITKYVIFDRYFTDIIADPRRTRIYLPLRVLLAWQKAFIPRPDYTFLLVADPQIILSRKQELSLTDVEAVISILRRLDKHKRTQVYTNDLDARSCALEIVRHIIVRQHSRNLRRLT